MVLILPGRVSLLVREADDVARTWRSITALLDTPELERAAAFVREVDRRDFLSAHVLARVVVSELTAAPISEITIKQTCPGCGESGHGIPAVNVGDDSPSVCLSWSHSAGRVAAIAAYLPVGVDLEVPMPAAAALRLAPTVLTAGEMSDLLGHENPGLAFAHSWTRKEALVKVGGTTIGQFRDVDLSREPGRWRGWAVDSWLDAAVGVVVGVAVDTGADIQARAGIADLLV